MKSIAPAKTALLIKTMSPRHDHPKTEKKLCSYLEIAW